jgi:hypothetical protein
LVRIYANLDAANLDAANLDAVGRTDQDLAAGSKSLNLVKHHITVEESDV